MGYAVGYVSLRLTRKSCETLGVDGFILIEIKSSLEFSNESGVMSNSITFTKILNYVFRVGKYERKI